MNNKGIVCGKIPSGKETIQLICSADLLTGLCRVQIYQKRDLQTTYYVTDFYNI